jgi:Mrp family chromosome partitioning ATPase/capsular polysaccharide biosynthesis protein
LEDVGRRGSSLDDYLRVLRRRKWIVLTCALLVPLSALLFSLRQTAQYEASSEVYLNNQNLASALTGIDDTTLFVDSDSAVETQANLASVPRVARRALSIAGVEDMSAEDLLAQSTVSQKGRSDILRFVVTDPDRERASLLATSYAEAFVEYRSDLDTAALKKAEDEVAQKLEQLAAAGRADTRLYDSLLEKQELLATIATLQTSRASVVRNAGEAAQVAPTPFRNALLGLALGLVLGVGLAFAIESLDKRVRHASEIGDGLGLPLLARIPAPPKELSKQDLLVMVAKPRDPAAEAFRILRTNLDFARLSGSDVRSIVVASALEEEGKSTTCANLAVAMARAGNRVCLVDLDLRRPYLARFFGLLHAHGISDVALQVVPLEIALQRIDLGTGKPAPPGGQPPSAGDDEEGTLDVLTSGPLPPDPGEFVGTHRLQRILHELRDRYDVVVIDAPPVLRVGDAVTLGTHADGVLVVTQLGLVTRPALTELRRVLEGIPVPKLGFVVTGSPKSAGYGATDAYGGYGYGESYYARDGEAASGNGRGATAPSEEKV